MATSTHTIIFIGRSGAGKGTQLELLQKYIKTLDADIPQYVLIMGDLFRNFFKSGTYAATIAKKITDNGGFQPDFVTVSLFTEEILHTVQETQHLFIDGYPRSVGQLDSLIAVLNYVGKSNPIFINIEVDSAEAKKRMLLRGAHSGNTRGDDFEEAIDKRLSEYDRSVVPVIEFLRTHSEFKYLEINGMGTVEDIHKDIVTKLVL